MALGLSWGGLSASGYWESWVSVCCSWKTSRCERRSATILQAFVANEELTEERKQAGAVIESGIMTMMAEDEFLTNFPAPFIAN